MNCIICKENKWDNVDKYRLRPHKMSMCKSCGFVTYPEKYKSKEAVLEYYRKDYRGTPPKVQNLWTGQRKLYYHDHFLKDLIKKWIKEGKKDPVITDIGAAFGLFLTWFQNMKGEDGQKSFPEIDLNGVELTLSFRRVAYHEFGILLKEDLDDSKQYDLITSYKVAEHMFDIDKELLRYKECLKPGGHLYISVPLWFDRMSNFGLSGWDIEYYYHPDHCNVWSKVHFERLLNDSGFKIIKEDHLIYDSTYMCVVGEQERQPVLPTADNMEAALSRVYEASELCNEKKFDEANEIWPRFPVARRASYEFRRAELHKKGWDYIKQNHIDPWLKSDPDYPEALSFAVDLALRYNKFELAIEYAQRGLTIRPHDENMLTHMATINRTMAKFEHDYNKKLTLIARSREFTKAIKNTSLQGYSNAVTWIYNDHAQIPIPGE